jgi:hypothetical protein
LPTFLIPCHLFRYICNTHSPWLFPHGVAMWTHDIKILCYMHLLLFVLLEQKHVELCFFTFDACHQTCYHKDVAKKMLPLHLQIRIRRRIICTFCLQWSANEYVFTITFVGFLNHKCGLWNLVHPQSPKHKYSGCKIFNICSC